MNKSNGDRTFFSYHVFFFPFKWEYKGKKDEPLEIQTDLGNFSKILENTRSQWEKQAAWYPPKTLVQYNESNYYYDFVRNALYDDGKEDSMLRHYRYKLPDDAAYCITLQSTAKTYRLRMDDILLHLYNTGVGVVSFHLYNEEPNQKQPEDILKINQYGRRLYPPFFGTQADKLGRQEFFDDQNWMRGLEGAKYAELPAQISLEKNGTPFIVENFGLKDIPPKLEQLPRHITQLFQQAVWDTVEVAPVLDDRMFVLCWYGNDDLVERVQQRTAKTLEADRPNYKYYPHEWWDKFIFVDAVLVLFQND